MKNIIFDFDGVIIDSMHIRSFGFRKIFQDFNTKSVQKLIDYHNENGGYSRFVKIKYFFNTILNQAISENEITIYANKYSKIMRENLTSKTIIINETINFIKKIYTKYNLHIASGSEQEELRYLNQELGISEYFKSIYGSPTPKIDLVKKILEENNYENKDTVLIGDSINDFEAAKENNIIFLGYNNKTLINIGDY